MRGILRLRLVGGVRSCLRISRRIGYVFGDKEDDLGGRLLWIGDTFDVCEIMAL